MKKIVVCLFLIALVTGCRQTGKQKSEQPENHLQTGTVEEKQEHTGSYSGFLSSIVTIRTFDNDRVLETGQGFFVEEDVIVTRFSLMNGANRATFSPLDEDKSYTIAGYLAVDRINNIVLLKTDGTKRTSVPLYPGTAPDGEKTIYLSRTTGNTIPLHRGKILSRSNIQGNPLYTVTNQFRSTSYGTPVFVPNQQAIGLAFSKVVDYEARYFVIPSNFISELIKKKETRPLALEHMNQADKAVAEANKKIKALRIETDFGDIIIRLFNETPAYRDNFIKLVREQYFDSLLIHRVIKGFCIQSGAADTRYASKDDVVGWKGPGYTLPAHIVPGLYHRRGTIGSPRKPDTENSKRRSDGSQFYIVTGRIYNDAELNEIEKQNHVKFTAEQRQVYKTTGGAPHIDGSYTIFGEVLDGMDVADRISGVAFGSEFRPLEDIRIRRIRILQ
ncbi:MAG: peptidylprolyl isomerase [Prolixibacteraceae bacterium]|jgi:cyclophilin family peptidyl-prolyl cis-trans isomerase|nr:peptidylprolyl isomerase [Prolixibacteraceae bacterium]